jgi:hypothetical protein
MKIIIIEQNLYTLQDVFDGKVSEGDYIEYKGEIYTFDGYDFGTSPMATNVETEEQIQLPHY